VLKRVIEQKGSVVTEEGSRLDLITILKESEPIKEQLLRGTSNPETPAPGLRLHRFAAESSQRNAVEKPIQAAVVFEANEAGTSNMQKLATEAAVANAAEKKRWDGRIRSYPHEKNGPYTCPKCKSVYATSQLFAAHVKSIHYKFESKSERGKRLTARYCKRNPRVEMVGDKPTIVWGNKKGIAAPSSSSSPLPPAPARVVVKSECVEELPPAPGFERLIPPPPGFGNPIPPLGFRTPIPPPPGFENMNTVPGFPLPSGLQRSTVQQEIQLLNKYRHRLAVLQ